MRPLKNGLDYFPFDVGTENDDKIQLIEAQHGAEGFMTIVKLWCKIYDNGYFYNWTEKEQILFSKRVNVDINRVNAIINDAIKWNLFNANLYETRQILTSERIQHTYIEAIGRRKKVKINADLLLIDINEHKNKVNVDIIGVNVNINATNKIEKEIEKETETKTNINVYDNSKIDLELVEEIMSYFGFTEMRNSDKQNFIFTFLNILNTDAKTEYFKIQFKAYISFKESTKEIKHSFNNFLGTIENRFLDGGWNARNWQKEDETVKKTNKSTNFNTELSDEEKLKFIQTW